MIAGLFVRHYKIYKGANYVPFGINKLENLNLFIGQNGAGKSSILEAFDTFFNSREFIYHTNEKKSEAFVCPLFIIEKSEISKFSKNVQLAIPIISEFLNSVAYNQANYKSYQSFFEQQKLIKKLSDTHYVFLFAFWPESENSEQVFITFDSYIKKKLQENEDFTSSSDIKKLISSFKNDLQNYYSYLYIPVETSIDDFLRLESKGMQDLMSEDVKKRIEVTLNEKLPIKAGRTQKQSLLDVVNNDLETFVEQIEKTIQEIDAEYDFQKEYKAKTRLTANHLTDVIVEAFFSKRILKKAGKPIKFLSAGERKKALIDIAFSFLTQDGDNKERKIILAIDEPESSLHISMCYDQFERLDQLANEFNTQLLITSHWYGSLPIIDNGNLFHIGSGDSEMPQITEFSFRNYFEDNGSHPNDVQFKSFFDLSSAIISSLRMQETNWLIVESEEDKNYILKHISTSKKLKVLPVGGCAIVKLLYNYLYTPISQNSEKSKLLGKVFCLIDTDLQGVGIKDLPEDLKNGLLRLRRLQVLDNRQITLHKVQTDIKYPTEIEEALIPFPFYNAVKSVINSSNDIQVKEAFEKFDFDIDSVNSFIKGDNSIIFPNSKCTGNPRIQKEIITEFIDKNKKIICDTYCTQEITEKPEWIRIIEDFFN